MPTPPTGPPAPGPPVENGDSNAEESGIEPNGDAAAVMGDGVAGVGVRP